MKATAVLYHDIRIVNKDNTSCVKVRVTYNRQQKYYRTNVYLSPAEWEQINSPKVPKELKQAKAEMNLALSKAISILDEIKIFTFQQFENKYLSNRVSKGALIDLYTDTIQNLKNSGRISTGISYQCSLNSLLEYKSKLDFENITPDFLEGYEGWMKGKGKSTTTIGIYLRPLRAIFNDAIATGKIPHDLYPFGKRKYVIPTGKAVKKALQLADVKKLVQYPTPEGSTMQYARDLWVFSYLCNGINVKDIAKLKYKNLDVDVLHFVRSKTERSTKSNGKKITVTLLPEALEIINKWGNKPKQPDNYIFPILKPNTDATKQYADIQQCTKIINKYMRRIADDLKIEKDVTTYTARHTFSTVLKRSGASIEFIQEALGHTDKSTTEAYLDSFEMDTKKKFARKLLDFGKK